MKPLKFLRHFLPILLTGISLWGLTQGSTPAQGGAHPGPGGAPFVPQESSTVAHKALKNREKKDGEDVLESSERSPLLQSYHRVRGKAVYSAPEQHEGLAMRALVEEILTCARSSSGCDRLETQAELLHLRVDSIVYENQQYLLLVEQKGHERGWGAYFFRTGPLPKEWIVQAPHTFYDEGTGILALELFEAFPFRAFYFNTIHRYASRRTDSKQSRDVDAKVLEEETLNPGQHVDSDVAHNPAHPFQRATEAVLTLEKPVVIQLHGFRETLRTSGASIIVSGGKRMPLGEVASRMADGLSASLEGVKRYPEEIRFLGGERNVQAQRLNGWPGSTFVHLELSSALRKGLLQEPVKRRIWAEALWASR